MGFLNVKVKVLLISTGILSMAMALKLTLPVISHFLIHEAPSISTFFLTPPYLYILLNFIILTILASSKFHTYQDTPPTLVIPTEPLIYNAVVSDPHLYEPETTPSSLSNDTVIINGNGSDGYLYDAQVPAKTTTVTSNDDVVFTPSKEQPKEPLDFVFSNDENEKPPVSVRFGQRKSVRATPEGSRTVSLSLSLCNRFLSLWFLKLKFVLCCVVALGVAKSKKQDTLESTWKTITEGRAMPLTRHLKKSDTWEQQARRKAAPLTDLNGAPAGMKKSETFNGGRERKSTMASPGSGGGGGRLRKEPSLGQDELNRRVEAFINKFNEEMRLQRQESLRQYREMINGGVH